MEVGQVFQKPSVWDKTSPYADRSLVFYNGLLYTSKAVVPANIEITNTSYWVEYAGTFLDNNFGNISDTGVARITNGLFPGDTYINNIFSTVNSYYTAPANGWISLGVTGTASSCIVLSLRNKNNYNTIRVSTSRMSTSTNNVFLPIAKDMLCFYYGTGTLTLNYSRFVYATESAIWV